MSKDYFKRVAQKTPTTFWINNVTMEEAALAVQAGAISCTQNPSYVWRILNGSSDAAKAQGILDAMLQKHDDDETVLRELQLALIADVCKVFAPIHKASAGCDGWVTIQGSPFHEDVDTIVGYARQCRTFAENLMIKIPATVDGIEAMRILAGEGFPLLATEVMSVAQAISVCEVFETAYRTATRPSAMMFAHIPGIFDEQIQQTAKEQGISVDPDALWQAGLIVAKKIRRVIDDRGYRARMLSGGARGLHHFTEMVGARSGVTINWGGSADKLIEQNGVVIDRFNCAPSPDVVDELREKLEEFRRAYDRGGLRPEEYESFGPVVLFRRNFETAWSKSLDVAARRRKELV